jgi:hypothetical protein
MSELMTAITNAAGLNFETRAHEMKNQEPRANELAATGYSNRILLIDRNCLM